jgi:hypothetical protein
MPHQITINGITYLQQPPTVATAHVTTAPSVAPSPMVDPSQNDLLSIEYMAFLMEHMSSVYASVDWNTHTKPVKMPPICTPLMSPAGRCPTANTCPFIFNTGATCHILPEHSDFKCLQSIPPHPIKGVGGSCVHAVGMGDIELTIAKGCKMVLWNALFIPNATVHLLSVLELNRLGDFMTHFNCQSCWVTDRSNTIIAQGELCDSRSLYTLCCTSPPLVSHSH